MNPLDEKNNRNVTAIQLLISIIMDITHLKAVVAQE